MRSKYYDATGRFVNYTWDRWCQDNKFLYPILDDLKQYEFEFEMERIYPLKQREVFAVYNVLKNNPKIKSAWVFGSSTSMKCTMDSDLDIAIQYEDCSDSELTKLHHDIRVLCKNGCDIVYINDIKGGSKRFGQIRRGVKLF